MPKDFYNGVGNFSKLVPLETVLYYGKTRHFYTRAAEHMVVTKVTEECPKDVKDSAIFNQMSHCNCAIKFDDFNVLVADSNKIKLLLR